MKSRIHVLVVDDNDDLRENLVLILSEKGIRTSQAGDGKQALDVARAVRPDIIVMDIFMPRMDGIQATAMLRQDPSLCGIPVIAQTTQPSSIGKDAHLFAEVLTGPCDPAVIVEAIQRIRELANSVASRLKPV